MTISMTPIGTIHSCFKEKFGIPRQPGLVSEARATLELLPPCNRPETVRGLEDFSHLWLIFVFHAHLDQGWKPTVRPPRLGGNRRLGVFATRSPFRPNPIGMSAVALDRIVAENGRVILHLTGVDLLDGTPVLDIKPYLPYADAIAGARGGFAEKRPDSPWHIVFSPQAEERCQAWEHQGYPRLGNLIRQILQNDPRPAYYASRPRKNVFGMRLLDFELRWQVEPDRIIVTALEKIAP